MCRSIKTLFNFAAATDEEIRAASLQFGARSRVITSLARQ
jgi:hypothetical protein